MVIYNTINAINFFPHQLLTNDFVGTTNIPTSYISSQ